MRSNSRQHKIWHTIIGSAGIAALIGATIFNSFSQNAYTKAFTDLSGEVKKSLAGPAKVSIDADVDQILEAAASKLMQQQKQIDKLQSQERIDHGAKKQIRDLFTRVDPRIISAIDAGRPGFEYAMLPEDFDTLKHITSLPGAADLLTIVKATPFEQTSSNNCGAQGGVCPGPHVEVVIRLSPSLKAR